MSIQTTNTHFIVSKSFFTWPWLGKMTTRMKIYDKEDNIILYNLFVD